MESKKETLRLEAFSDGVFAIAITLLILDIHVPEWKENETLIHNLSHEWASFLAFLIGFLTILICWINHHYMFQLIRQSNSVLALINGFKLLVVSITPFATALLSRHLESSWAPSAINLYCLNFTFMGIAMTSVWCYSFFNGLTESGKPLVLQATTKLYIFASIISSFIWLISFVNILACLILSCIMFLIFIFPERMVAQIIKRGWVKSTAGPAT